MSSLAARVRTMASRHGTSVGTSPTTGLRLAGVLAVVPTAAILLVRVGINAPIGPDLPYGAVYDPLAAMAVLGPAAGAIILALTTPSDVRRVTLAFAGVFGVLSLLARPAIVPASVAIVLATGALVVTRSKRPVAPDDLAETLVGVVFLSGMALSLAGTLGIAPPTTRSLGSSVSLLAMAGAPVFVAWRYRTALAGLTAAVGFAAVGFTAPFVTGAASLVGGAIVGASLPVMALGVLGGVTVVATGVDRRSPAVAIGGLILLAAGIPATVPRGLAVLVGLSTLLPVEEGT